MASTAIRDRFGRLVPTGECWCGCDDEPRSGSFFASGHDKRAESAVINIEFGGVAEFLLAHGYGPDGKNPLEELERWRNDGGTTR
jgi:hypothetical protein